MGVWMHLHKYLTNLGLSTNQMPSGYCNFHIWRKGKFHGLSTTKRLLDICKYFAFWYNPNPNVVTQTRINFKILPICLPDWFLILLLSNWILIRLSFSSSEALECFVCWKVPLSSLWLTFPRCLVTMHYQRTQWTSVIRTLSYGGLPVPSVQMLVWVLILCVCFERKISEKKKFSWEKKKCRRECLYSSINALLQGKRFYL